MTQQFIQHDAVKAFDVILNGGIGILPMDIGYSLIGGSSDALMRIFNAKGRAIGKLNALVGDLTLADELLNLTPQSRSSGENELQIIFGSKENRRTQAPYHQVVVFAHVAQTRSRSVRKAIRPCDLIGPTNKLPAPSPSDD